MKCVGMFALIMVCGVLSSCQKDAVKAVNNASSLSELGPDASSKVFPKVLAAIDRNPKDEDAWKALYRYRTFTDAGGSLLYAHDCFHFFVVKNPSLLFERYSGGDAQAMTLMKGIFRSYDPTAFTAEVGDTVASAAKGYRKNRDMLLKKTPATKLGTQFVKEFSTQCAQWAKKHGGGASMGNLPASFLYGDGKIEVGQSKSRVVEEIQKSVRKWHDMTLTVSAPKDTKENRWVLSYGAGGGAAPGSGTLILDFKNDLLVSLNHRPAK